MIIRPETLPRMEINFLQVTSYPVCYQVNLNCEIRVHLKIKCQVQIYQMNFLHKTKLKVDFYN